MRERWLPVPNWPTYEASTLGRVRRTIARNGASPRRILTPSLNQRGYLVISLYRDGKRVNGLIHKIICETFHGPRPSLSHEVAHGDGCRTNNSEGNLRWDTRAGNHADKLAHGTHNRGERHGKSRLTDEQAIAIIQQRHDGKSIKALAGEYRVHLGTVRKLLSGESWQWLPRPPKRDHRRRAA